MEAQRFFHLLIILTGIFFFSSVCTGMLAPELSLESTVFVAFEGEDLQIDCNISKPANTSEDTMECFDPFDKKIYVCALNATAGHITKFNRKLQLNNVTRSGEYHCRYLSASVYWFLRVRDPEMILILTKSCERLNTTIKDFNNAEVITSDTFTNNIFVTCQTPNSSEELPVWSYTESGVAGFTGVLLVFSVVGSIYVFRGHWKEPITKSGKTSGNQRQSRGETERRETEEDNVDQRTAPSTSFYASLQPRPRSIYDVLDRSAANQEPDQRETKPNKNEHTENTEQTTQPQDIDVFDSVYENF